MKKESWKFLKPRTLESSSSPLSQIDGWMDFQVNNSV